MKKLLATVLAVVLAMTMVLGTALAAETELATSNADITDAVNGAPAGSKIIIKVEFTGEQVVNWETNELGPAPENLDAGWGVGGLCTAGDWGAVDGDFEYKIPAKPEVGATAEVTFDVDAVKQAASGNILVNFFNGYWVRSVVLKTPDADPVDNPPVDNPGSDTPQTADTMTVVLFAGVAILALAGVVVTKKARA